VSWRVASATSRLLFRIRWTRESLTTVDISWSEPGRWQRRKSNWQTREGESYSEFARPASGLEIETELSFITKRLLRKTRLFYGWATIFDQSFDETQKRLLLYIFRIMIIEFNRDNRGKIAESLIFQEEHEEGTA
jgi:hypothetical protein